MRRALHEAREPGTLLFQLIPAAVGIEFDDDENAEKIVAAFSDAFVELGNAYPSLLARLGGRISGSFGVAVWSTEFRAQLVDRAERAQPYLRPLDLRGFCGRLADAQLNDPQYIAGVAAVVVGRPPKDWRDRDEETFIQRLAPLVRRFVEVEALQFMSVGSSDARKVSILRPDGAERSAVLHQFEGRDLVAVASGVSRSLEAVDPEERVAVLARLLWDSMDDSK